jgi:sporulation protein YlmC with PRC-barrel domain
MRLGELLNRKVVTESGMSLGRIHDVTAELSGGTLRIIGLVVGESGLKERLGVGASAGRGGAKGHGHPSIPWSRVARVGPEIVLRD